MAVNARIQVLNREVDDEDVSEFRILVDGESFKYITIDPGIYDPDDMVRDYALLPLLPELPQGDWNQGHIARHPDLGNPVSSDWLDLRQGQKFKSNVCIVNYLKNVLGAGKSTDDFVIKFARFPWEQHYYDAETAIYKAIDGHEIGPKFMGHLTEEGRVVGFVLERIQDARHANPSDLKACMEALGKLHRLGILHGDVNRHNFLVREVGARKTVNILDFEGASQCSSNIAFEDEMMRLQQELSATSGIGGYHLEHQDTK